MLSLTLGEVADRIESLTPSAGAEKWDNVGLLVGDPRAKVTAAVISIDLTEAALDAAKSTGANLILNHHPCIFPRQKGLARVTRSGASRLVYEAARRGIGVISTHTNFDRYALEAPLMAARALGAKPRGRLHDAEEPELLKLVVFVPKSHGEKVRDAICAAGAGRIGAYDSCTFSAEGTGTFRGSSDTNPFLGRPGRLESARELRLETIFPRSLKKTVLKALRESHPYEEIAYDLYRVEQEPSARGLVPGLGYGFYGDLDRTLTFHDFAKRVKKAFQVKGFWASEPAPKKIKRVGFVAGKGASFARAARDQGCDVFVTGEAGYHVVREMGLSGMAVVEVGHTESEIFFLKTVAGWCKGWKIPAQALRIPEQKVHP